jgi:hypothetical protein
MWDIAEKRITNEETRRTAGNSPTMELMMEMRRCRWLSKLSGAMEKVKISEANAWRIVVSNTTTDRETAADHTPRLHNHPQKAWFGRRKRATKGMDD